MLKIPNSFKISMFIFLVAISCNIQNNQSLEDNNLILKTKTIKSFVMNLEPIVVKDKITLEKPLDINSNIIREEIEQLNKHKINSDEENLISIWLNPVNKWNEISETLIKKYKLDEEKKLEILLLLNIGLYDTLVNTYQNKFLFNRSFNNKIIPSYPSDKSAISEFSLNILTNFFPEEKDFLLNKSIQNKNIASWGKESLDSDIKAGEQIGKFISKKLLDNYNNSKNFNNISLKFVKDKLEDISKNIK